MLYSAWGKDGVADTFVEGDQLSDQQRQLDPELQLMKVFEAPSWNQAMQQYHQWQGWEPYQSMLDADENEYPEDATPKSK